jgi:hypothetical protein
MQSNDHGSWLSIWLLAMLFGTVLAVPLVETTPGPTNWLSQLDMSHTSEMWMTGLRLGSSR